MADHFNEWGWFSFLKYVAEKGVIFYRQNGKSNLENIKETKLHDVLIWASEQNDYDEVINDYYDKMSSS
ncbi:MAG: hypothetical protein WBA59_03835 [Moheibacter sp.]